MRYWRRWRSRLLMMRGPARRSDDACLLYFLSLLLFLCQREARVRLAIRVRVRIGIRVHTHAGASVFELCLELVSSRAHRRSSWRLRRRGGRGTVSCMCACDRMQYC